MESKKAGVAILDSDKADFKPTKIKQEKKGHCIMVKGAIQQEELTILNIPNTGAPRFINQVFKRLTKGIRLPQNNNWRFSEPTVSIRSMRKKICNNIQDLNTALDKVDLADGYRTLYCQSTKCTFF